ncbi:hypothetical protein [Dyella acidiphila]|uniref:Methanol dehydrogenase n=1 Tax=Dyella acidiphila TaxID=2775866 RepID=A0ABR9G615_9GAMM|nr:hypothetical protein [Dyella acidiphila]MBE1159483.1 hypothetical protein [Dyella acidiphila]
MKAGLLIAVLWAMAGMVQAQQPLSAAGLAKEIDAKGAKAVVEGLGDRFDGVLDRIDTGDADWIALVPRLAQGTDAGNSEGLSIALAYALPKNPAAVLAVVTEDGGILSVSRVCSIPFIEDSVKDRPGYKRQALRAMEAVRVAALQRAKESCFAVLSRSR